MSSETVDQILRMIEDGANSRPSAIEFEMAYQSRVAIDRIRFAIKATEQGAHQPEQLREAALQLLDALGRLEKAERSFQQKFRSPSIRSILAIADQRVKGVATGADQRKRGSNG
jgi:hypothetical protein